MSGHRRYKLDLYARGVTATTGTITKTFASSEIAGVPSIGGQIIRAADGVTESAPWAIDIVDKNSTMTSLLVDATSGRYHLLGRLVRIRQSLNSTASTAYASIAVGRVTDVSLNDDVATYRVAIGDERWIERNTDCFVKANTATLVPRGFTGNTPYGGPSVPGRWWVYYITGNLVVLWHEQDTSQRTPASQQLADFMRDDLKDSGTSLATSVTAGNFRTLRWRNLATATDYEVSSFGAQWSPGGFSLILTGEYFAALDRMTATGSNNQQFMVVLVWPTSQPTAGSYLSGYLYAPTHAPTDLLPLHVDWKHPLALARELYQGTYSSTGIPLPRISTTAFTALEADSRYGRVAFRITRPYQIAEFLDEFIYPSYGVAPVYDSSGRIAPRSLVAPTSSIGVASLPGITSTNALTHPTWTHPGREWVTVVRTEVERVKNYWVYGDIMGPTPYPQILDRSDDAQAAADGLGTADPAATTYTHDTVATVGRYVRTRKYGRLKGEQGSTWWTEATINSRPTLKVAAGLLFQRFGDGPAYATVECTSAVAVLPGNFCKMGIGTMPAGGARGTTRVYQVMARLPTPRGFAYDLLDYGAGNALAAPSVALALVAGSSRHAATWTLSSVPTGSRWSLESGYGATTSSTAPAVWIPVDTNTTGTLTRTVGNLPSRTKVFGRAYAFRAGRLRSPYSAVASVVTAKITGPTAIGTTGVAGGFATVEWTNGSTLYPTAIMVDAATSGSLGSSRQVATIPARTTHYTLWGLNLNDSHKVGVRHVDAFGGASTMRTTTFTTTTSYTTAPLLKGVTLLWGLQ